jgi:hypothetical protein
MPVVALMHTGRSKMLFIVLASTFVLARRRQSCREPYFSRLKEWVRRFSKRSGKWHSDSFALVAFSKRAPFFPRYRSSLTNTNDRGDP